MLTALFKENTSFEAGFSVKYSTPFISTERMFSGIHINSTTDHFYEYELEKVLETKNLAKMFIHHKEFLKMNYISLKFLYLFSLFV